MSSQDKTTPSDVFDFPDNTKLFEAVLSRRAMAFIIDAFILSIIITLASIVLFIIGIATFGLLWLAIAPFAFIIVLAYVAFTTGGEHSATPGMRALGLEIRMTDGRKLYKVMAVFHALAFYFFSTILTPLVVLVGLFTKRQRLLHDFISGAIVVNRDALPQAIKHQ